MIKYTHIKESPGYINETFFCFFPHFFPSPHNLSAPFNNRLEIHTFRKDVLYLICSSSFLQIPKISNTNQLSDNDGNKLQFFTEF
jgi:hypothetical protein